MNKLMIIIFASIFIFLSSYSPVWAEGWGMTNWGMNIAQVEKATKGKVILNEKDLSGYSHKLQDNVPIGEHNFEVCLNFTNSKLDKVMLRITSAESHNAYLYLVDELKKKYGSPSEGSKEKRLKISGSTSDDTEWITQDMVIKLSYFFMVYEGKTVKGTTLQYYPRQSASSGNL